MWFKIDHNNQCVDFYMEDEYGRIVHDCQTFKEARQFFAYIEKEMGK